MTAKRFFLLWAGLFALIAAGTWAALSTKLSGETRCLDAEMYYFPAAKAMWEGRGPLQFDGRFCTHQPPGYATVLILPLAAARAAGISEVAVSRVVNIAWAALAGVALVALLTPKTGQRVAIGAAAVAVLLPQFLWLCRNGYNEPMFTAVLLWAVVLAVRGTNENGLGFVLGAAGLFAVATLTRSIGLLIPPIVVVVLGWRAENRWKVAALWVRALALYGLLLTPWIAVVSAKAGKFTPVSTSFLPSHIDGLVSSNSPEIAERALQHFTAQGRTSEAVRAFHRAEWARSPLAYAGFWVRKAFDSTYASESKRGQTVLGAITIPWLLAGAGCALSLWRRGAKFQPELALVVALFGYFFAMDALVWSTVRYLVPVLWIPVALVVWALAERFKLASPAPESVSPA